MEHVNPFTGQTLNSFCPTGKGGGIDPTCGRGGLRKHKISSVLRLVKLSDEEPYVLMHERKGDLVQISTQLMGDQLQISDIRSIGGSGLQFVNKMGVKTVRKVLRAILSDYPGVKSVTGTRALDRLRGGETTLVSVRNQSASSSVWQYASL